MVHSAAAPNWFQRLIQWRTIGRWTHVRLAIQLAHGWEVLESREGGVRQTFCADALPDVAERVPVRLSALQLAQVRGPVAAQGQLVGIVNGKLVPVAIGPGVSLVLNNGVIELRAAAVPFTEARLMRAANGSWTLPQGCALARVYRNGLRQYSAVDYTVSGSELRFREGSETTDPSEADDIVVAECR